MNAERYVVLGLARPRAPWFSEISRWATSAALPIEFVKCLTPEEVAARLASGRRWSALVVDASSPGVDRDLLDVASRAGTGTIVVADPRSSRDWVDLGARAVLPSDFDRDQLLAALAEHARPVASTGPTTTDAPLAPLPPWQGRLVAVTGTGGTGASTVAAVLAQGLATSASDARMVLLADLCLDADQAVLHDTVDVVPGLPELVDAHRLGRPDVTEVRHTCFAGSPERPYDLLLGLRRHRDWTALRPRAVQAALHSLRHAYRHVVVDVDPEVEGERETGSHDVEERNLLARSALREADAVLLVLRPDVVGLHRGARLAREMLAFGVPPERMVPIVNRIGRSPRHRSEITATFAHLVGDGADGMASPTFLAERRRLDDLVRSGGAWPAPLGRLLADTVSAVTTEASRSGAATSDVPERIVPGSLGTYADLETDAS
ncbi:P-loop NTPase family protein [Actinomarinicola tropica]|uniref:CobQ/CobB/MinD/ParA nucleotide binding domain-containing protein n=1 Tax=Actinomarinicola tropica TaxID=2789776 RepID=A0A5Q2RFP2_9ACTN|nr:hypothetical protein [Actinomarinicola tropica]QGG95649.1 hypothetical protein GH723_11390 [Actinomarinicola tropica]